ncbi:MAG: hypothetical protein M3Z20_03675 [Chloroflexota bacterium]|nr:hypothetical protein [Chloroflexota bacterium]
MWKRVPGCAGMVAALVLVPALVQAQDATPTGAVPPADLTAMVLFPDDVPGSGLALDQGYFEDPADMVLAMAERTGKSEQEVRTDFAPFGYGRRYALRLAEGWPTGIATPVGIDTPLDNPWGKTVTTIVTEFPSAEDAAAAFTYIERDAEAAGNFGSYTNEEDRPLNTVIGDDAELTSAVGLATDERPYTNLNLTFRSGNLIGDVMVDDFLARELDSAEIEGLAGQLLARMEAARNGEMPDLGQRVLRFAGPTYGDSYTRLDGITFPRHGDSAEVTAERQARSSAQTIYVRDQDLEGTAQGAYIITQVFQFASPDDAAAVDMDTIRQRVADDPVFGAADVITDGPALGDASQIFHYAYADDSDYPGWSGYGIVARSGSSMIVLYLDQGGEFAPDAAVELAETQLACVTGAPCPDEQPIPASLLAPAATPIAQATPAA